MIDQFYYNNILVLYVNKIVKADPKGYFYNYDSYDIKSIIFYRYIDTILVMFLSVEQCLIATVSIFCLLLNLIVS